MEMMTKLFLLHACVFVAVMVTGPMIVKGRHNHDVLPSDSLAVLSQRSKNQIFYGFQLRTEEPRSLLLEV